MIAAWMLYALLVSVLMAAGAWLLEEVVRQRGGIVRFLWLGALVGTVGLVAVAPLRTAPAVRPAGGISIPVTAAKTVEARPEGVAAMAARALRAVRTVLARPLQEAAALGTGTAGRALAAGWGGLSLLFLALAAGTALRARRARRRWPVADVAGAPVRVSPGTGPAVLGIVHPEVVVPAWLLHATEDEQRLVVLHEREHVRARDPLLLAVGCVAVALLPWSPAAWWMLLRLRAAVELDCDARVLRAGVPRRAYGSLLIDMAGRGPGLSLGVPALAGSPSTLERRLRAMNVRLPRFARTRAGLFGVLGFALLAGACDTPLPTTAEVQAMDVATLEAKTLGVTAVSENVTYYVDGKQMTAAEAHALVGDQIVRMDVTRGATPAHGIVRIHTRDAAALHAAVHGERLRHPAVSAVSTESGVSAVSSTMEVHVDTPVADGTGVRIRTAGAGMGAEHPLLVIDGVLSDERTLHALGPEGIERVDVLKGEAATREYSDPRAANGVIRITTKKAAGTSN
ncbi:MAG TPA: M56 family metallopeptidase [Longimicrobium sp.]|nr:M56 family metallopeptidase [Longimicrobium sp.]